MNKVEWDERVWVKDEERTKGEFAPYIAYFKDPNLWHEARVKWDGCIDLYHYRNTSLDMREPGEEDACDDYIHICDIDNYIEELLELKRLAKAHFGEDWNE